MNFDVGSKRIYLPVSQAGPGNDINAGSPGSQKAPTQSPASLVQPVACARWRRHFAFSLALRLPALIVLLDLAVFFIPVASNGGGASPTRSPQRLARSAAQCQPRAGSPGRWAAAPILDLPGRWLDRVVSERAGLPAPTSPPRLLRLQSSRLVPLRFGSG